ncbi:MAG: hypothetical protein AB7G93_03710 [Bdellovibrionales bacterium]
MRTHKLFLLSLLAVAVALAGCQPRKGRKDGLRVGRLARGPIATNQNGQPVPLQPKNSSTLWGEVTALSNAWDEEVRIFTWPSLKDSPGEAIGFVSGASNQATGIGFWGYVPVSGQGGVYGSGQVDANATIHIEVYDDKYGQVQSDGEIIPPLVVHIGRDQPDTFKSVSGSVNGTQAQVTFADIYGQVHLEGTVQAQDFTGTMKYCNVDSGCGAGQWRTLGHFRVPTCGFFICSN